MHDLVMETLQRLATEGFSELDIEASLNRIVMAGKTAVSESGTLGVDLLQQLAGPWVWGWDVFARLRLGRRAERLRRRLADGEDVFRPLVQHYLLDNPHRINVTLLPSATLAEEQEDAEWDWIQGRLARMSFKERQEQVEQTKAMAAYQAAADPPEVSDAIPSLKVADLDPSISAVATEVAEVR